MTSSSSNAAQPTDNTGTRIIVIGASAGGVEALTTLVARLNDDIPAALFIVLHIPSTSHSYLPTILSRSGPLPAKHPVDGELFVPGQIYIAPPDHHLLVMQDYVRVVRGPSEHGHRPAIDPLFRSAALTHGPNVIGVILSGALNDGTVGLKAVREHGGLAIVQDPDDTLIPDMPLNALEYAGADYTEPVARIGPLLSRLCASSPPNPQGDLPVSEHLQREVRVSEGDTSVIGATPHGTLTVYACPDCGGPLWEMKDGELTRFRCRNGHAYTGETVLSGTDAALEDALWTALNTLENSAMMAERLALDARANGRNAMERRFSEKAILTRKRAQAIRNVLLQDGAAPPPAVDIEMLAPATEAQEDDSA